MKSWSIQVQAQFTVTAETFCDASDLAVDQAMEMEPADWGTVAIHWTRKERAALVAAVKERASELAEPLEPGDEECGAACAYEEAADWASIAARLLDGEPISQAFGPGWTAEFGVGAALVPFLAESEAKR
jgi:hypothetical protein